MSGEITLLDGPGGRYIDFVNTYGSRYDSIPGSISWVRRRA